MMTEKMEKLSKELSIMRSQSGPVPRQSLVEFPDWNEFEFCTEKEGAYGPSKKECLEYYSEK